MGSVSGPRTLGAGLGVLMGVTLEFDFHALGQQAPAALLAATGKDVLAVGGLHALAIAELLSAGALGGLIGSFGHIT